MVSPTEGSEGSLMAGARVINLTVRVHGAFQEILIYPNEGEGQLEG